MSVEAAASAALVLLAFLAALKVTWVADNPRQDRLCHRCGRQALILRRSAHGRVCRNCRRGFGGSSR